MKRIKRGKKMSRMTPLIFLDVDGVLNSTRTACAFDGYGFPPANDATDLMRSDLRLDPVAVGLVRRLVESVGASIVISSTWRLGSTPEVFRRIFKAYGWANAPVIDMTPNLAFVAPSERKGDPFDRKQRGEEVRAWLEENRPDRLPPYVILDDFTDFYDDQPLVLTNPDIGLSFKDYQQALGILQGVI